MDDLGVPLFSETSIKIMFFPQFRWLNPLGFSNGDYINTHCFNGGWNPTNFAPENKPPGSLEIPNLETLIFRGANC